jgi:hypothetical protein
MQALGGSTGMRSCRVYSACPCGVCVCVLVECASEKTSANRLTILPVWHRVNSTQQLRECAVGWRYDLVRHGSQQDREDEYAKLGSWRWRQQGRVEVVVWVPGGQDFSMGGGALQNSFPSLPCWPRQAHTGCKAHIHMHTGEQRAR